MPALNDTAAAWLAEQSHKGLQRTLKDVEPLADGRIRHDGRELINFSSNDYFGLSQHAEVKAAGMAAVEEYGAGAGASRLVTGNHPLYTQLENALAAYKGSEAALVFGSGYMATLGTVTALMGEGDLIISDKLAHACMVDAARLSGASFKRFAHNDLTHLEALLKTHRAQHRHCLVMTETIFSMDGDAAPLEDILALADRYDAWVLSDDAHGIGFVSPHAAPHHIQLGTMSKGLGSYGGYVCASRDVIDWLTTSARSVIYTTALPPATIAAASKALDILTQNKTMREMPLQLAEHFCQIMAREQEVLSPIVPLIIGESEDAVKLSQQLYERGFWVSAIRPPTVPPGTARLRITFTAAHTEAKVDALAEALNKLLPDIQSEAA